MTPSADVDADLWSDLSSRAVESRVTSGWESAPWSVRSDDDVVILGYD